MDLSHLIGVLLLCYSQFKDKTYVESTTDRYRAGKMGQMEAFTFLPDAKFQKITNLNNPRRMP
jgi:hypothetical protein